MTKTERQGQQCRAVRAGMKAYAIRTCDAVTHSDLLQPKPQQLPQGSVDTQARGAHPAERNMIMSNCSLHRPGTAGDVG